MPSDKNVLVQLHVSNHCWWDKVLYKQTLLVLVVVYYYTLRKVMETLEVNISFLRYQMFAIEKSDINKSARL